MREEPVLKVQNLKTELYLSGRPYAVVKDVSFDLYRGKTLAIVGESGCGKSLTALSLIRVLPEPPALHPRGKIWYQGINLLDLSEKEMRKIRGGKIAMIFQDPLSSLNPVYTIGDQLAEAAALHLNLFGEEAYQKAEEMLNHVGIPSPKERLADYPHQLSGGMRQRVMIAQALISKPDVLIADEPTTALDVTIQAQVIDLLKRLQKEDGMAILLITHDMGVVSELADEVLVMYASEGIESGSVDEIFENKSHPYTQGLFNSRPSGSAEEGDVLHPIPGIVPQLTDYPSGCRFHPRCPFAMKKCTLNSPPLFALGERGRHQSACYLEDGTEESEKMRREGRWQ
ncbi:ABC transporter ATP-binding protein [Estrella lausannensis]|uniref:Putative peptide import ATP-binding protein/BS1330_II0402 n=1 Tax=Estrella lausannensis TaxID=483423 RepID=A0A0H5DT08_9BACT|nr:ABC transporter ATP-binding protein [Estrella lausannensis]CRX38939.1 Putative peptide import ATP-binding protein/BS1330_II0402 [Estrella lausannensis]